MREVRSQKPEAAGRTVQYKNPPIRQSTNPLIRNKKEVTIKLRSCT
jgi:hypothetical protein